MKTHLDWSAYENLGSNDAFGFDPGDMNATPSSPGSGYGKALAACNGNGQCKRPHDGDVMCPSFRALQEERHSPHGRIEALKALLEGRLSDPADPAVAAAMETCLACKGCKRECPNGVDVAALRTEYLALRKATEGTSRRARLTASLPYWVAQRHTLHWLSRLRNAWSPLAWLGERLFGLSAQRRLPIPATQNIRAPSPPSNVSGEERRVILLVDCFSRLYAPDAVNAALRVLAAAGYTVELAQAAPDDSQAKRPLCCGRTFLANGMVEDARREARRMLAVLGPMASAGYPVIGLEPSCLLMLRDEYYSLGLGPDVARLARQALLFEEFIAREHHAGRLTLTLRPLERPARVHGHCHQKAFGAMRAMDTTLGLIPGLRADTIKAGCCGMAGSFGLEAEHAGMSLTLAEQDLLPAIRAASPDTTIVANGFSCRHQIEEGSGRQARHVAELLAEALA